MFLWRKVNQRLLLFGSSALAPQHLQAAEPVKPDLLQAHIRMAKNK